MNHCKLYPSRLFLALILGDSFLALLIVFILPVALWARYVVASILACWVMTNLLRDVLLVLPSSWVGMRLDDEQIVLFCRNGKELPGKILPGSVVTPLLTVLNVSFKGKRSGRSLVLFPDSLDKARFRELRVQLKWGGLIAGS